MDVIAAYQQVGSYRAAAAMCGTTHKTVRRIVQAQLAGDLGGERRRPARPRRRNFDPVADLVADKIAKTRWSDLGEAAAAGRSSCGLWRFPAQLPAAGGAGQGAVGARSAPWPSAGGLGTGRDAVDRLGCPGRAARVLRGAGLVAGAFPAVRHR